MDGKGIQLFDYAENNMKYLSAKQKALSENIANIDTPGYQAKDVVKGDFASELRSVAAPRLTNSKHLTPNSSNVAVTNPMHSTGLNNEVYAKEVSNKNPYEITIDDNEVTLEEQLNEMNKVRSEYGKTTTLYKKYQSMLRMVVRD